MQDLKTQETAEAPILSDKESMQEVQKPEEQEVPKLYEYSDAVLSCGCGNEVVLEEHKQGTIQIHIIPADNRNALTLACDKCGANITLKLVESVKEEEEKEQNDVQQQEVQPQDSSEEAV